MSGIHSFLVSRDQVPDDLGVSGRFEGWTDACTSLVFCLAITLELMIRIFYTILSSKVVSVVSPVFVTQDTGKGDRNARNGVPSHKSLVH